MAWGGLGRIDCLKFLTLLNVLKYLTNGQICRARRPPALCRRCQARRHRRALRLPKRPRRRRHDLAHSPPSGRAAPPPSPSSLPPSDPDGSAWLGAAQRRGRTSAQLPRRRLQVTRRLGWTKRRAAVHPDAGRTYHSDAPRAMPCGRRSRWSDPPPARRAAGARPAGRWAPASVPGPAEAAALAGHRDGRPSLRLGRIGPLPSLTRSLVTETQCSVSRFTSTSHGRGHGRLPARAH